MISILLWTIELFTKWICYIIGDIEGHAGYVDYCYEDQISKIELLSMAKEFKLDVEGCTIWWLDVVSGNKGFKEIQIDLDTLSMAMSVDSSKEVYVYIKIKSCVVSSEGVSRMGHTNLDNLEEDEIAEVEVEVVVEEEDLDLEGILIGCKGKWLKDGDDSDLNNSSYNYSDE